MTRRGGALLVASLGLSIACRAPSSSVAPSSSTASRVPTPTATATEVHEPALAFAQPVVELRAAIGQRQSAEVRLIGRAATRAQLTIASVEDPALQIEALHASTGATAGLRLSFTGDRAGTRTGQVVVATGIAEPPRLTLLYALRVPDAVTVTPSNPTFNLRDPGTYERPLRVRGSRADFRVLEARVATGPFRAVVEASGAGPAGEATVRVTVDAPSISSTSTSTSSARDQRGFLGRLRLRTNDPTQPEVEVPLFAMGALPSASRAPPPDARHP